MRKIYLLFVLIFISCENEIQYLGTEKVVIKGKLNTENNVPIPNHKIAVNIIKNGDSGLFGSNYENNLIAFGNTDSNGNYTFVFSKPTNFDYIEITTNENDMTYNSQKITQFNMDNFLNFQFDAPTMKIFEKQNLTKLNIILNQQSANTEISKIEYIGIVAKENIIINTTPETEYYENFQLNKLVKKNQTLIVRYTKINYSTNVTTVTDENIIINDSDSINYTINY
ncbi:peptidase associated/transthyretin-like domain-containing protein [Flavobacterium difficile]|uniref:Lipoprotein n=1 Tax=Flavobacterium difficile TaxID=2709659 RepID=A0ABX0I6B8_9FLAO|nr:hypothetical protein [Flavobacterium difficile]NHM02162.1 hypothetical protein [Flavobacterium difficile]